MTDSTVQGASGLNAELAAHGYQVTVGPLFREQVMLGPGRPAVEYEGRVWSYARTERPGEPAGPCAWPAAGSGAATGSPCCPRTGIEYVELLMAAAKLGVLVGCQNWRLADAELTHCLNLTAPKLIDLFRTAGDVAGASRPEDPASASASARNTNMRWPAPTPPSRRELAQAEDGLIIIYTSGTTGLPKAAVISQRAEIMRAMLQRVEPVPIAARRRLHRLVADVPPQRHRPHHRDADPRRQGHRDGRLRRRGAVRDRRAREDRPSDGPAGRCRPDGRGAEIDRASAAERAHCRRRARPGAADEHRRADRTWWARPTATVSAPPNAAGRRRRRR